MWTVFRDKLLEIKRTAVPTKFKRVNGAVDPSWITMAIKKAINTQKNGVMI